MAVDDGEIAASLPLTNEWLIRACAPLFQRMKSPIRQALSDGGFSMEELDELVMVGGSSHMPSVRSYVSRILKREPAENSRPDTAIALGAGICAGMKSRAPDLKEFVLTDVCPFTLGVGVVNEADPEQPLMSPVIERNCVLPTSKERTYYPRYRNQKDICIKIFQGENLRCSDNLFLGYINMELKQQKAGRFLGTQMGEESEKSVRVRFTYDINGLLEVEVVNGEGKRASLVLKNQDMSAEEVRQRLKELSALKLHPREQERPRALIARAERLYAATTGNTREYIVQMLGWYQSILNQQDPLRAAKASARIEQALEQLESMNGGDLFLDSDLFSDNMEDEEDELS